MTENPAIVHQLRRWIGVSRRIARQAYRRRVLPDFSIVAAGLEECLMPAFVVAYRRGTSQAKRMTPMNRRGELRTKAEPKWNIGNRDDRPKKDNRRRFGFWLFAGGAALVAVAVRNAVARVVDYLNRSYRRAMGLVPTAPLGVGPGGVVPAGVVLTVPVPAGDFVPVRLPPVSLAEGEIEKEPAAIIEDLNFPVKPPLAIIDDEIYGLAQRAILEYAEQVGADVMEWVVEKKPGTDIPDERVCKYCRPLNGRRAPIGEPFFVYPDGGMIFNAPLHARCRCEVRIVSFKKGQP